MSGLHIRRAEPEDSSGILALLSASLGWLPDEHHAAFFAWKHESNPFGPSPSWVAIDARSGSLAGFRTFLRWEFERDGQVVRAVRAVDTATAPAHQGKGVFRQLTEHALAALHDEGVAFVFNTPNDQSRPGYLKMGWEVVGRVPVRLWPRSLAAIGKVARARTPAALWSEPNRFGVAIGDAIADGHVITPLAPRDGHLRTRRGPDILRWRYGGFPALAYRAVRGEDGTAVFRLRRRGPALEAAIVEVFPDEGRSGVRAARSIPAVTGADYALAAASPGILRSFVPLPRQGPILTWRALRDRACPPIGTWSLSLGDIELF